MRRTFSAIAIVACALMSGQVQADTLKVAHFTPETTTFGKYDKKFAEKLAEATGGKTKLQFFWAGALGTGNEIIPLIAGGAISLGVTAPAYYPSEMPITGMLNSLPTTFKTVAEAMNAQRNLSSTNEHFLAEFKKVGVYPILQHGLSTLHLMCTKPIRTVADMKGLKIRTFGYYLPLAFSKLGFVPVTVPLQDQYEALGRGVIDCVPTSYGIAMAYKLDEVAKYWSDVNLGAFAGPAMYVNHDLFFNVWSEEKRNLVKKAAAEVFAEESVQLDLIDKEAAEAAKAKGVEILAFEEQDKVDAATPDMISAWEEKQIRDGMAEDLAKAVAAAVRAQIQE